MKEIEQEEYLEKEEIVQFYGTIGEYVLVADLLENIDFVSFMKDYPFYSIYVVNKDGKNFKKRRFCGTEQSNYFDRRRIDC